jgi:hypothetical protein
MGREVRRVPADWQHPKEQKPDWQTGRMVECYKPLLHGERYQTDIDAWDEECTKWKSGWRPDYRTSPEERLMTYEQWAGQRPHRDDYMPDWPAEKRTHLMMYEDTSEGTPISPAFETPEELARWLADTGASAFGDMTASYDAWLRVACGGFACSAVYSPSTGLISGVEGIKEDKC